MLKFKTFSCRSCQCIYSGHSVSRRPGVLEIALARCVRRAILFLPKNASYSTLSKILEFLLPLKLQCVKLIKLALYKLHSQNHSSVQKNNFWDSPTDRNYWFSMYGTPFTYKIVCVICTPYIVCLYAILKWIKLPVNRLKNLWVAITRVNIHNPYVGFYLKYFTV